MYSFAQRADTRVIDEPFYAYYLNLINAERHPGHEEILNTMPLDFEEVMHAIRIGIMLTKKSNIAFSSLCKRYMTH